MLDCHDPRPLPRPRRPRPAPPHRRRAGALAPAGRRARRFRGRRRLRLACGRRGGWRRCRRSTGSRSRSCAASTGSATRSSTTPSASPAGLPANNALLWGARGMGKSSLVKAVHAEINRARRPRHAPLKLIEIHREDIETPAGADGPAAAGPAPLHRLLRRPLLRWRRHLLQVAEGGAGGRHRGPARQRRSSTPPRTGATCCRAT